MFVDLFEKLARRQDLSRDQASQAMRAIMSGQATPVEMSGLLLGLAIKGPRAEEIVGLAREMRAHAVPLDVSASPLLDLCGTGGDHSGTFNISSVASLVVASCGVRVAKHGNRGVSSACGSHDLFAALGVNTEAPPSVVARCIEEAGIGFLFAPAFHPSMRHAAPVRRELRLRTVFNLLGPLTNPARPTHQLLGVPRPELTELIARALASLGAVRAWVVHGADGLDELSTTGHSKVSECRDGTVRTFYLHPSDVGLPTATREELAGADAAANAAIARRVLAGQDGPARHVVLLNAGAALFIAGSVPSARDGVLRAAAAIDSGEAGRTLERMVEASRAASGTPGEGR